MLLKTISSKKLSYYSCALYSFSWRGVKQRCMQRKMSYWNRFTLSWSFGFITKLKGSVRSFLSVSSSPCSHLVPYHRHRSLPVSPNPPSVSILPFPSCSSYSASVFVEEPVKVRPAAAVQTRIAPHRFLVDFLQAITIAQHFHYCHHGASHWRGAELAVRICDKMKMKESFRELRRNYKTGE